MTEASSNEDQQVTEVSPPPLTDIYWNEYDSHEEERVSRNDIQQLLNELITGKEKLVKGQDVLMSQQKELLLRIKSIEETLQSNPLTHSVQKYGDSKTIRTFYPQLLSGFQS